MTRAGLISRAMGALAERARAVGAAVLVLSATLAALGRWARSGRRRDGSLRAATELSAHHRFRAARPGPPAAPARSSGPPPASPPAAPPPASPTAAATSEPGLFSLVTVHARFHPRLYAATFAALQVPMISKLLDLTRARVLGPDLFERLAAAWTAPPGTVPRLGIVLPFERWVMLRDDVFAALRPLAARGVHVAVLYEEQATGPQLAAWFSRGVLVHNLPAVIATLTHRSSTSPLSPVVLDTLTGLLREATPEAALPPLLTDVASLALSCGGAEQAATLAREALDRLPELPSATRSQALRSWGAALLGLGQTAAGLALLDRAIAMAADVQSAAIGASALCQSGLYALHHGDLGDAERRFREAIALLSPPADRPHLLALAHHNLAVVLMHQGRAAAEYHAKAALALRPDPSSDLAKQDRLLLTRLRDNRTN
jgi:tetratricopeptide (TPR) repeat protein